MKTNFNPLLFLAPLGAGGIAVMPFALLQYMHPHGAGLVTWQGIMSGTLAFPLFVYFVLAAIMVVFTTIHVWFSVSLLSELVPFARSDAYRELVHNPLKNASTLAPLMSAVMTLNVIIGPVRFFIPTLAQNLQLAMPYAFFVWLLLAVLVVFKEVRLLTISFTKGFDVDKIHFGWLLHPLALALTTVVGTGIAALAQNTNIAHAAAFLSLITGTMGVFLFAVKTIALFKKHFASDAMPEKHFLPTFLVVVPGITLFAISLFRFGHYLEHMHGYEMGAFFLIVTAAAFAFETWYLLFGLSLLREYFKTHYFEREYYPTLWAFICPFVGYAVLAAFTYDAFLQSSILIWIAGIFEVVAISFYFDVLLRHVRCARGSEKMVCE